MTRQNLNLLCKSIVILILDSILSFANGEWCAIDDFPLVSCPPTPFEANKTICCWVNGTASCCPPSAQTKNAIITDSLVIMISVLVMLICITLSVVCIICCFWSPCPLYSMCRINYTYGDVVAYCKQEESALSLPPDESFLSNTYSPVPIKVIQVSENS